MIPTVVYESGLAGGWLKKVVKPVVKAVKQTAKQVTIKKIASVPASTAKAISKGVKAVTGGGSSGDAPAPEAQELPVFYELPPIEPPAVADNTTLYAVLGGVAVVAVGTLFVVLYRRRKAQR